MPRGSSWAPNSANILKGWASLFWCISPRLGFRCGVHQKEMKRSIKKKLRERLPRQPRVKKCLIVFIHLDFAKMSSLPLRSRYSISFYMGFEVWGGGASKESTLILLCHFFDKVGIPCAALES